MLYVINKLFVSFCQISIEKFGHHIAAPFTSFSERLIVDILVLIKFINVGVYRGDVGIYTGQVLPPFRV